MKNKKTKRVVDLSELASTYHSIMIGSLGLFLSAPVRVLVIGLGGGSLPIYIHSKFPLSNVHVVEIDPAIVRSVKIIWGHFLMKVLLKLVWSKPIRFCTVPRKNCILHNKVCYPTLICNPYIVYSWDMRGCCWCWFFLMVTFYHDC